MPPITCAKVALCGQLVTITIKSSRWWVGVARRKPILNALRTTLLEELVLVIKVPLRKDPDKGRIFALRLPQNPQELSHNGVGGASALGRVEVFYDPDALVLEASSTLMFMRRPCRRMKRFAVHLEYAPLTIETDEEVGHHVAAHVS